MASYAPPRAPALERALSRIASSGPTVMFLKMMVPGLVVLSGGLGLLAGWKMMVVMLVFGGALVVLSAAAVQLTYVWPMIRRMRRAASDAAKIVWISTHATVGQRSRIVHEHVDLGLESGQLVSVQTSHLTLDEQTALLDELRARAPHATFGYSPEHLKRFRANPGSLRVQAGTPVTS